MTDTSNRIIDAGYADPINISEHYLPLNITQNPIDIKYTFTQQPDIQSMIKSYLIYLDKRYKNSLKDINIITSAGGSTQLIAAFYYAIQKIKKRKITVKSCIIPPYYALHKEIASAVKDCEWIDDINTAVDIEVIVSPNNPDGRISIPSRKSQFRLLDSVYDVPQFTGKRVSVNEWKHSYHNTETFCEVASLSKVGLPGLRLGYALVKNKLIASLMDQYIQNISLGLNTWALKGFTSRYNDIFNNELYTNVYQDIQMRQTQIRQLLPNVCISTKNVPFVFLKMSKKIFDELKIIVRIGSEFSTNDNYLRISLMISNDDWVELLNRLSSDKFKSFVRNELKLKI